MPSHRRGDALGALNALLDLHALLARGLLPLQFVVRHDAQQRIVDLVDGTQLELR
jgi:hypothetical protein